MPSELRSNLQKTMPLLSRLRSHEGLFAKKFDIQLCNKNIIISRFNRIPICNFHTHGEEDACHPIVAKKNGYGHGSRSVSLVVWIIQEDGRTLYPQQE
jgi:hypothetical protein